MSLSPEKTYKKTKEKSPEGETIYEISWEVIRVPRIRVTLSELEAKLKVLLAQVEELKKDIEEIKKLEAGT